MTNRELTFDALKGLRAEGYIRDSSESQCDGFGPEIQRKAIENFAKTHGLVLGNVWYTDFITGTSTLKRSGFRDALMGAKLNYLDVLLVYRTSRFARNRADALRYKANLRKQYLWGDINDEKYRQEQLELERQLKAVAPTAAPVCLLNLDRASQLLADLPSLWKHPGVTDDQRESFVKKMFRQVRLWENRRVAIEPRVDYQPLFACIITEGVRKYRGEWI